MKKFFSIFVAIVIGFFVYFYWPSSQPQTVVVSNVVKSLINGEKSEIKENIRESVQTNDEKITIPITASIKVPFIVQAPFANWSDPYKEACEEASVLMIHNFYRQNYQLSHQQIKDRIDILVSWGNENFHSFDSNAEQTASYFTKYFNYDSDLVRVIYDMTINDIKAMIARGYPVIIPAAGRELGNKYFQNPGPVYHMLVITGYDEDEFITNDPGTKNGEGYRYKQAVLFNAIHDLTIPRTNINVGRKAMIVVMPKQ